MQYKTFRKSISLTGSTTTLVAPNETTASVTLANPESDDISPLDSVPTSPRSEQQSTPSEKDTSNEKDMSSPDTSKDTKSLGPILTNVSDEETCSKSDLVKYFLGFICFAFNLLELHLHQMYHLFVLCVFYLIENVRITFLAEFMTLMFCLNTFKSAQRKRRECLSEKLKVLFLTPYH